MTKANLIDVIANETGLKKKDIEAVVDAGLVAVVDALKAGDKVALAGFGNFAVKAVPARQGRNPKTNEAINIPASKKASFSAAKALKDALN